MNRKDRRLHLHSNPACKRCGILWSERFDLWSTCTVNAPPGLIAEGHRFI